MNKILMKEKNLTIEESKVLYIEDKEVNINIEKEVKVDIYHYVYDHDVLVNINLNCENASVNYYLSNINIEDHKVVINVNHNKKLTTSNIFNHGVNLEDNSLSYLVNGIVPKNMSGVLCNQENQIINIKDGKSTICPNLLIDCYDVNSSHSAYIGKFSKEKLFYLESRGLTKKRAYQLLIHSFLVPSFVDEEKIVKFLEQIKKI